MKHNRKQLRELVGTEKNPMKAATLRAAISRGKLIPDEAGLFDDQDPVNAEWIAEKTQELQHDVKVSKVTFNTRKAELETQKAEEDLRMARIKRQKMEGEVIPTDLSKNIFRIHNKNLRMNFTEAAKQIVTDLGKMVGASKDQMAKANENLIITINNFSDRAMEASRADIQNLVEEYADGKGRKTA